MATLLTILPTPQNKSICDTIVLLSTITTVLPVLRDHTVHTRPLYYKERGRESVKKEVRKWESKKRKGKSWFTTHHLPKVQEYYATFNSKSTFLKRESMNLYQWLICVLISIRPENPVLLPGKNRKQLTRFTQQNTLDDILYSNFTQQVIQKPLKSFGVIQSGREKKGNRKREWEEKYSFGRSSDLFITHACRILWNFAVFSMSLSFTHKTTSLVSKTTDTLSISAHLISPQRSFYFMKPKWNSYIKGLHGYSFTSTTLHKLVAQSY